MHAATASQRRFTGFTRESLELLRQFEANNDRAWYKAHRRLLRELLVVPAKDLVIDLGPMLRNRLSPALRAEPHLGGSILRPAYDARFARARPYRTHVELWFWEGPGASHQHPGFFVRVTADRLVLGAGITLFPPELLLRFRELVDEPATGRDLMGILDRLAGAGWQVTGPCLRRMPRPYPADHERAALLRHVGLRVERTEALSEMMPEATLGPILPELLVSGLTRLLPFHAWLRRCE